MLWKYTRLIPELINRKFTSLLTPNPFQSLVFVQRTAYLPWEEQKQSGRLSLLRMPPHTHTLSCTGRISRRSSERWHRGRSCHRAGGGGHTAGSCTRGWKSHLWRFRRGRKKKKKKKKTLKIPILYNAKYHYNIVPKTVLKWYIHEHMSAQYKGRTYTSLKVLFTF